MKRKILYLSQAYPYPADGGGKIKTLQTLETLAREYRIYAVFISEVKPKKEDLQILVKLGITVKVFYSDRVLASVKKDLVGLAWHFIRGISHYQFQYFLASARPAIQKIIDDWKPDVIHVDHLNMSQYLPKRKQQVWILEHHNVETYLYWTRFIHSPAILRKLYLLIEMILTYFFERKMLTVFDHILAISDVERGRLKSIFGRTNVSVQPLVYPMMHLRRLSSQHSHILFIGNLGWPPNEDAVGWFLRAIFPLIVQEIPDAEFHVVGKRQLRYERNWQMYPNVFLHGYQKDTIPYLSCADVFVLPFRMGGGLRLKSFTALASKIPIVTTSLGVDGLRVMHNRQCLVGDSANTFAQQTIRLLRSPMLQRRLAQEGKTYIRQNHSPDQSVRFLRMYHNILAYRYAP
ncbi:glycosyltransferase [Candidatus Gottesmanbacteria bacterium]|nr:glycosyltransferase [Candidatus Gottesmanbacteria bacterium]